MSISRGRPMLVPFGGQHNAGQMRAGGMSEQINPVRIAAEGASVAIAIQPIAAADLVHHRRADHPRFVRDYIGEVERNIMGAGIDECFSAKRHSSPRRRSARLPPWTNTRDRSVVGLGPEHIRDLRSACHHEANRSGVPSRARAASLPAWRRRFRMSALGAYLLWS